MSTFKEKYKVLLLEDNINDAELIKIELANNVTADLIFELVKDKDSFINALNSFKPDIVISDYNLPQFTGFEALKIAIEYDNTLPFVISTGSLTEELAADSIKLGAWDYVVKERLHRLPGAFENALRIKKERVKSIKVEKELEESQRLFQNLAQVSPVGIFRTKADGFITYVNPKWCELSGISFSEALGFNWITAVHPDDRKSISDWQYLTTAEFRFIRPEGDIIWVIANTTPEIKEGHTIGYIGTLTDITERKNFEAQLIKARDKAEASDRLKTAFMNNISHEIRTPLNGILGFSSLLIESDLSENEKLQYSEYIDNSSKRLVQTITDYMDISLITSGSIEVNNKSFTPLNLFNELHDKFKPLSDKHNIPLVLELPQNIDTVLINADEELIFKVMSHLLDNAFKFTTQGNIILGAEKNDNSLKFFVKDTGIGINTDALDFIFDNFRQEDSSTSRGYEGSGLGLAIVKGFVKTLGSNIIVESVKGQGSVFCFSLPCSEVKSKNEPLKIQSDSVSKKSASVILIAEDDTFNYLYMETILKKSYDILHAEDGQQVVEMCRNNPDVDIILMDIKMPKMNGLDATMEIRKFNKDIPIIAVTAHAQSGDYQKCLDAGCNEYIPKPLQKDFLYSKLNLYGLRQKN